MKLPSYLAGVVWSFISACAGVLLPFGIFIVFARATQPILIGVVATAVACTEILKTLGLQGLYEALLQQQEDRERCHQTASFLFILLGAILVAVYLVVLDALGWFTPEVAAHYWPLSVIGLRIFFDLVTTQPQAELAHRLSYRMLALRAVIANVIAGSAGIFVALRGNGLVGLVIYQVIQSFIILLATTINTHAMARPVFHPDCFRRMIREASLSTCVRGIAATINNLDQILVSALVGGVSLAYFNLGKRIESTFITMVSSLTGILFQPQFARRGAGGYDETLRRSAAVATMVCGLPAAMLMGGSLPIIRLLFGHQWDPAATLVAVFALSGFARASGFVPGALMSVSGRNRDLLITSAVSAISGVGLVAGFAHLGIVWCAAALAVKNAIVALWLVWWLHGQATSPLRTYFKTLIVPFLLMACGVEGGRWIIGISPPGEGTAMQLGRFVVWLVPAAAMSFGYFMVIFHGHVRLYYAKHRRSNVAER